MKNDFCLPEEGKILIVDKPAGWTSFDMVNKIRHVTGVRKVGHAGTLDPFATGILLVCLGAATKKVSHLMELTKEYIADIALGYETDTMDLTGKFTLEAALPELNSEKINMLLASFLGEIEQEIPAYSAAKFKGRRLYKLAREGRKVPVLFKKITILDIELLDWKNDAIKIRIKCGKGTYIRTLARDIGRKLGSAGYVKKLVRTRVGNYSLSDALTLEALEKSPSIYV